MHSTRRWFIIHFLLIGFFLNENRNALAQETLFIGAIPDQNPERLNRLYRLLCEELNKELDVPVRYIPITNYPAAVSGFRTGSLDLVWFGGLTGVQARLQKPGAQVLAQRDIDLHFQSVFIANLTSQIPILKSQNELTLLKDRRFTFGSESSTSGRLMPQHFLQQVGVSINDFKGGYPGFSGSHDATLALVQSGSYEAGVLNKQVWETSLRRKKVEGSKVRIIWETPSYPDYHWLAQPDLDNRFGTGFTRKLQNFLLGLKKQSKTQSRILNLFGANRFIPAYDYQYKDIELIGRQLGKIK